MIARRVVDADANESAKHQVELQPLHQLPLRAHRIESLQQHRPQQLPRRIDGRPVRAYSAENSPVSAANASFTISRIARNG